MTNIQNQPLILVVDDEALLRWRAADVLVSGGYQVIEADDAATALRILEDRTDVRVLFTDVQMPGALDGLALARQVHARWPAVMLLVTSGRDGLDDSDVPDDGLFVPKPYGADDVLGCVRGLIDRTSAESAGSTANDPHR